MRVNLGCGATPTPGWVNIDNSLTVRLARTPVRYLLKSRTSFINAVRNHDIRYGNAVRTGLPSSTVDVLYTSHMMEHLDRREAALFLREARRILKPGGKVRIAVPDLKRLAKQYVKYGDADAFMEFSLLAVDKPVGAIETLKFMFLTGFRRHHWMYDAKSLAALLQSHGFSDVVALPPGHTTIADVGELDFFERAQQSIYVEATR